LKNKIAVIGSGFAGISAATVLAEKGNEVHLFEKNEHFGGRARQFSSEGFLFDMGPSWYWMPDVFERYFNRFGYTSSDFYDLKLLDPSFSMVFEGNEEVEIPADFDALCALFESIEKGSADKLIKFMDEAEYKYNVGINDLVYKPGLSLTEFADVKLFRDVFRLQIFSSFSKHVQKFFKNPKLVALMEFPVLFLGAMPEKTPALYSLMNYAGLKLGTWYPMGGFHKVVEGMKTIAEKHGVHFYNNEPVKELQVTNNRVHHILANGHSMDIDAVIGAADYHHIEQKLLAPGYRNYDEKYWDKKTFAPSSLLFYLGVNKKIKKLKHHTLFFDNNLKLHSKEIYEDAKWPTKPLFYVCCPSKTDSAVAPVGQENIFVLMPIAPNLKDSESTREEYYHLLMERLEDFVGEDIRNHVTYKRSYCVSDFKNDYNAYKGNAYGLANTLMQTAILKPKIKSNKVNNLYFAGQLTVPGPGVPPSIISGQVAANELLKQLQTK
jgi:phytoene desaturase